MGINLGGSTSTGLGLGQPSAPAGMGVPQSAPQGGLNLSLNRDNTPAQQSTQQITSLNLEKVQTPTGLSLNLTKGLVLDMEKDIAGKPLNRIRIGLGWDPLPGRVVDLDTFCLLTRQGHVGDGSNVIFFNNRIGKGVVHNGDNRNGEGEGDDETIDITLSQVPNDIDRISIFANIYEAEKNGLTFGALQHAYIRILDLDNMVNGEPKELCRYVLPSVGAMFNAFLFGNIARINGAWKFESQAQPENGNVLDLANKYI